MSKDIYLTKNMKTAEKSKTIFNLEDDLLTKLYNILYDKQRKYPLLWRMIKDFYGDFYIDTKELCKLKKEIENLLKYNFKNLTRDIKNCLIFIKIHCDVGIKKNKNLLGVAD